MVKGRWRPCPIIMALRTIRWEIRRSMIWVRRAIIITLVTADAGIWGIRIISVMTSITVIRYIRMSAC